MKKLFTFSLFVLAITVSIHAVWADDIPDAVCGNLVQDILKNLKRSRGLCVDIACGTGQISTAIAKETDIYVHGFEDTDTLLESARKRAEKAGIYGSDIHFEKGNMAELPYPDHSIDCVIRGDMYQGGAEDINYSEIFRILAPGGIAYIGQSSHVKHRFKLTKGELTKALNKAGISTYSIVSKDGVWAVIHKKKPSGIGGWSHEIRPLGRKSNSIRANAHNLGAAQDDLAKGPFTLAFTCGPVSPGGKGASQTMNNGYFVLRWGGMRGRKTPHKLQVFNGYNGIFLWETMLQSNSGHSLISDDQYIFLVDGTDLVCFNIETGKQLWQKPPQDAAAGMTSWTVFAYADGVLTAGLDSKKSTAIKHIYAFNPMTGEKQWDKQLSAQANSMCMGKSTVFVSCTDNSLKALRVKTGAQLWSKEKVRVSCLRYWPGKNWIICGRDAYNAKDGTRVRSSINRGIIGGPYHLSGGLGRPRLGKEHYYVAGFSAVEVATQKNVGAHFSYGDPAHPKMIVPSGYNCGLGYVRCYGLTGSTHCVFTNYKGLVIGNVDSLTDETLPQFFYYDQLCRPDCDANVIAGNGRVLCPPTGCGCDLNIKTAVALAPISLKQYKREISQDIQLEKGEAYPDKVNFKPDPSAWPAFRHDSGHTGITDDTLNLPLAKRWVTTLNGTLTPPVAADGRIFVASDNHKVYGLSRKSGDIIWSFTTGGSVLRSPVYWQGRVYAGSMDGYCYCLRADTGKLIWRFRGAPVKRYFNLQGKPVSVWPVSGGVVVDNGVVNFYAGLAAADRVFVYALNAQKGTVIWGHDKAGRAVEFMPTEVINGRTIAKTGASPFGMNPWGILAANDTTLFIPLGMRPPGGIDRKSGDIKWFAHRGNSTQRSSYHIQWKGSMTGHAGGHTVVLGGKEWVFAGGHNTLSQKSQPFKVYQQNNGRQMYQDHPNLFMTKRNDPPDKWVYFRNPKPGPDFGASIANCWGQSAVTVGGYTHAPILDMNAGNTFPEGLLYNTYKHKIQNFKHVKRAQIANSKTGPPPKSDVTSFARGAVILTAQHHIVGTDGGTYIIIVKGTGQEKQSVSSLKESGSPVTDGLAVSGGNLIVSTKNSNVVCMGEAD
ncbi:PQQ-binding-like beta-propeller repeat protein [Planctomycetota bacterium]